MSPEERSVAIAVVRSALVSGCVKAEFLAMRCPVCGSPLKLAIHPTKMLFFVRCDASSIHLGITDRLRTRPSWMHEYVSEGWY
jgi:hypothetical protein